MTVLSVEGLTVRFGMLTAVRDVSLAVSEGEVLGIVGESGSGKSLLGLSMMGMPPESSRTEGAVRIAGEDILAMPEAARSRLRGRRVAMVFQEPMTALNPLRTIGNQIAEPIRWHEGLGRVAARKRVLDLMQEVGLPDPEARMRQYPHELSGGQRQRALIALALACNPAVLVADEPTTALDALVANRVLALLRHLTERRRMALVLISHDLDAIARATGKVAVMYGGALVETGPTAEVLATPRHPYTIGLIGARPRPRLGSGTRQPLPTIPGTVPPLSALPRGCRFHGRCGRGVDACGAGAPPLVPVGAGRLAACIRLETAS